MMKSYLGIIISATANLTSYKYVIPTIGALSNWYIYHTIYDILNMLLYYSNSMTGKHLFNFFV